jgi:hypothetical protein
MPMEDDNHVGLKGAVIVLPITFLAMWVSLLVVEELRSMLGDGWFQGALNLAVVLGGGVIGGFALGWRVASRVWGWRD